MANKRAYTRSLSMVLSVFMAIQLAVVPVGAAAWSDDRGTGSTGDSSAAGSTHSPADSALQNTYALVVTTGGQSGESLQYFKIIYEDTYGIRRSEYILTHDNKSSFETAQSISNSNHLRDLTTQFFIKNDRQAAILTDPTSITALRPETRDTYLFEPAFELKRLIGIEIMQNSGQWDCQGLWFYKVDEIYGEEMYGYISDDAYINFSGWRLAELEMNYSGGQLVYTTLQTSRPKLYRMGEEGHPEFNLIMYDEREAKYDSTNTPREHAIRIDITDIYGAGIENLTSYRGNTIEGTQFRNALTMSVRFQDTFGCVQTISVPVLPSGLIWALEEGVPTSTVLSGYAQQGDTLLFPMTLPFFADLLEVTLHYDGTGTDELHLSSVSMYDLALSIADVAVDQARASIVPTISYNPVYYWQTTSRQGYSMSGSGSTLVCDMKFNENGTSLMDTPLVDEYLVEISTDEMPSAGTTGLVSLVLSYITYEGIEQHTEKILLNEQCRDFHGYTPGDDNMYYWLAMRPGGTLHFRITIPYVREFTSISLSLEDGNSDDWQMSELNIYRLDSVSKREITWGSYSVAGRWSDRYYDRSFSGDLIFSGTRSVLVQQGDGATMNTDEGGGAYAESALPDSSLAWSDIKYSMSYDEALQDIGFTTARNTYQVEVTVAGNTALAGTEDAGSKNQFYFQLIFQDGNSGYVLANQQLSGDGFRSGYTETFAIRTNQDYGELVSVRIIPEDVSSTSDQFDKLNIDTIQVIRRSDGGLSRQWSLERVGWIDIDFREEAAANGMLGQAGRTEAEMAREFNVTYSTYAVNLLISITTLASPFSGTVYGDICYYNSAGELKHKGFDIVELIYEYTNKTPQYSTDANGNALGTAATSDNYMFQADKTDRFIITLSDARELAYLEIEAYMDTLNPGQGGTWHIGGVAVSLIESEGNLLLNENDEYERDNTVRLLTTNVDTNRIPAYQMLLEPGAKSSMRIRFIENELELDTKRGNVSLLSREPISQNDTLNIYVYPDLEKSESSEEYTVKAAATFTSPNGMRQASAGTLNLSDDGSMFYMIGVKAPGMTVLNSLGIQAESPDHIPNAYIDRAIVQQVRSGVIINTYEVDYQSANIAYAQSSTPYNAEIGYAKPYTDEQVVMLTIGEFSDSPIMLQPETKDLAVALTYIPEYSANDSQREYDTPFIFLTDQQISTLRSGQLVSVTFNEEYVKEITGIVLVATGGLSIPVNMACVGSYRVAAATGERIQRDWYSFSDFTDSIIGTEVGRANRQLGYNGYSVKPLKLQFTTAPATTDTESGVTGSVELMISYVDDYGAICTETIPNLRLYATSQSPFATDTVTDVELLVEGMKELRWLQVRPYDDNGATDISWKLSSVSAQLGLTGEVQKRSVDDTKVILESSGRRINFSSIAVLVNVQAESNTGKATNIDAVNESVSILLDSGKSAKLTVTLVGSYEGYTVTADRASSPNSSATADASDFLTQIDDVIYFDPGTNYTGASIYYRITVTSDEVGTKTVINFEQSFEKEPEPEPVIPPTTGTDTPGAGTVTGGEAGSTAEGGTPADVSGEAGSITGTDVSSEAGSDVSSEAGSDATDVGGETGGTTDSDVGGEAGSTTEDAGSETP